jgi:hypothetical protein
MVCKAIPFFPIVQLQEWRWKTIGRLLALRSGFEPVLPVVRWDEGDGEHWSMILAR